MDYTIIKEFFDALTSNQDGSNAKIIVWLAVAIVMLVITIVWTPLKRHDRCKNRHAILSAVWILGVCYAVLSLNISYWWLMLCCLPFVYIGVRWFWFKREYKNLRKIRKRDLDIAQVNLFLKLSKSCVFEWEIRNFVIPLLKSLYDIGAYKMLEKELDRFSDYNDNMLYAQLKILIMAQQGNYREMERQLKSMIDKTNIHDKYYQLLINNLYVAVQNRDDISAIEAAFSKLENYVAATSDKDSIIIEILMAMAYRYDIKGDKAKLAKVMAMLNSRKPKTFHEYLVIKDVELFYNRRHENKQGIIDYLDEAITKADKMEPDEESRLIFKLRILPRYIEFDHRWKEMTNEIFKNADYYLEYSMPVAIAYIEMITNVISNAFCLHGMILQDTQMYDLMKNVYHQAAAAVNSLQTELHKMDDIFLYRKRDMYRIFYLFARVGTFLGPNVEKYISQLINSHKEILELCRYNGQKLEYIHFLMTYIDEFITLKDQLPLMHWNEDVTKAKERMEGEEPHIKELLSELKEKLKALDYNASVAYPTLWAAEFSRRYDSYDDAKFLLQKFQEHKIDIRNYTEQVQRMYHTLRQELS